jgi:GNAT superfamily N-acetyltransferase
VSLTQAPAFREVTSADAPHLLQLFEAADCRCYCRYWHFAGDKNAWLDRVAHAPEDSARELTRELEGTELPHGVVAALGDRVLGWMKLTQAARVQKLYAQRPYRGLDSFGGDRTRVMTIGCALVHPEFRRQGVARELLRAAVETARNRGAVWLEALPRQGSGLDDAELWMGPFEIYEELGFHVVNAVGPYPVLRKEL